MKDTERSLVYLMRRIVLAVESVVNGQSRSQNVRIEEIWVLFRLLAKNEQTVGELATETGIERSTLSRILTRMEQKALLCRERLTCDQRSVTVSLTKEGRKLARSRQYPTFRDFESILTRGLSLSDVQNLKAALILMVANIGEMNGGNNADSANPLIEPGES